jgi:flagellar basal body-associated protein FliL
MAAEPSKKNDSPAAETPPTAGKPTLLGKIKVLAIVAVLVAVECLVAYLVLPSAADVSAQASAASGSKPEAESPPLDEPAEPAEECEPGKHEQMEISLGQFMVSAFQPGSGSTLRIDFRLFGMVASRDEKEFTKLKEANLHRFRDQVIITLRSAEPADLTDPDLSTVKRRLLERTNRVLGKPLLRGVVFSEFSCIEQ